MAVKKPQVTMQMPIGAQVTEVTLSPQSLCHYIRDDELDRLGEMRKDLVMEICLASTGVFFGSLTPAVDGFKRFGAVTNASNFTDLVSMLLFFAAAIVALITGFQWYVRSKAHKDMVLEIRERPKVAVRLAHDNAA